MTIRLASTFLMAAMMAAFASSPATGQEQKVQKFCDAGQITRAAFDIGSTGPKLRIACVVKTSPGHFNYFKIMKVAKLKTKEIKIKFSKELKKKPSADCKHKSYDGFRELVAITEQPRFKDVETRAAATAAFRQEKYGAAFIDQLNKCFAGMNARIVSQSFEGELEYLAVANVKKLLASQSNKIRLVWGIGSTSVQFTFLDTSLPPGPPKFLVFNGGAGSKLFLAEIKKFRTEHNLREGEINPISAFERNHLLEAKKTLALKSVPTYLRQQIANSKVFGIGGGHKYLLVPPGPPKVYTLAKVGTSLGKVIGKSGQELLTLMIGIDPEADELRPETVSNLVLVEGLFTGLGISKVEVVDASLADGVLVYENW